MRTKLTNAESIRDVVRGMTIDEKLNLVGEYTACHTLAIPDLDIPSICLMDGVTGLNGTQGLLDYITSPEIAAHPEAVQELYRSIPELTRLNYIDLEDAKRRYEKEPYKLELVKIFEKMRPGGKQNISFPSGINIGSSFDLKRAYSIGESVGWEMRAIGVDITLGPNVDVFRDPLGGRGYEMYGEDPYLVERMSVAFINGVQSTGTAACAKHYLANNQETNRNSKNTHVSERTLREIYARGFKASAQEAGVKSIMTAYNAINGEFTSYSKTLLSSWIRDEWGYDGVLCCDWGAVKSRKEKSLEAGMDLILSGPNDMRECKKAIEEGKFSETILDNCVGRILKLILEIKTKQQEKTFNYNSLALLENACETITEGSVLLKNKDQVLPLSRNSHIAVYGKRSKMLLECGTGSTSVITGLHSNVYDECEKQFDYIKYEDMDGADVLIYTVTAIGGENIDRSEMDIEKEDQERLPKVLREAKQKGLKTVVILNIAGPVDIRSWIEDADSVLSIFIPGCMGGVATAKLLCGDAYPGGKLSVTFPVRYEDTPSYPNFPGEHNDVYYGEGIFVGYRYYEKKKLKVMFPFGFGLGYTTFKTKLVENAYMLDAINEDSFSVLVEIENTGSRIGSEVIQIYASEEKPHVLRPLKELVGFEKIELMPGESRIVQVKIDKKSLCYYDIKKGSWITPTGTIRLYIGTPSEDIFDEAVLLINGVDEYALSGESTLGEILSNTKAVQLINEGTGGILENISEENMAFMIYTKLDDVLRMALITKFPDAVLLDSILEELYEKLKLL